VRAICAWCQAEGAPADLGEREPLDDPSETHGLCERHLTAILDSQRSQSFPGIQLLIVIKGGDWSLYEYLSRTMADVSEVEIIMERRSSERRRRSPGVREERRRAERRRHRGLVQSMGCTFVRFVSSRGTATSL